MSIKFSNVVFTLHGEGEENTDIWNKYFKDGRMQEEEAQIIINPYDKNKLV